MFEEDVGKDDNDFLWEDACEECVKRFDCPYVTPDKKKCSARQD